MSLSQAPAPDFNRYGSIASEIYDLDKPFHKLPDTAFYLSRLSGLSVEILEPGCGSGRTLIPLLQAGHKASGFDTSPEMLGQCRARCTALGLACDLTQQSFELFVYDRTFAAIVLPVSSFTLIARFETAAACLRRFHDALQPGGRLIFDVTPLASLGHRGDDRRQWQSPGGDLLTIEGVRVQTNWIEQSIAYTIRYERWRDGTLVQSQLERMRQRFWGVEEMRLLLGSIGFSGITITPDYAEGKSVTSATRTLTYEACRG